MVGRFPKLESHYMRGSAQVAGLFLPIADIVMAAVAIALCLGVWAVLTYTGSARRCARLDNPNIAAAFGVPNRRLAYLVAGASGASTAIGGMFVALLSTLAPSQIFSCLAWFLLPPCSADWEARWAFWRPESFSVLASMSQWPSRRHPGRPSCLSPS